MHAENFLVDEGGNGEAIEDVAEDAPESDRVPAFAFVVETVDSIDLRTFVIASQKEEVLGILDLVAEKKANGLDRLLSTVNVVTKEKIVRFGWEASIFKYSQKIVVLSMNIA